MKLTINNTFHQSTINLIIKDEVKRAISLSSSQVKRAELMLCGMDCTCGKLWGSHVAIEGYENSHFEPIVDPRNNKVIGADLVED